MLKISLQTLQPVSPLLPMISLTQKRIHNLVATKPFHRASWTVSCWKRPVWAFRLFFQERWRAAGILAREQFNLGIVPKHGQARLHEVTAVFFHCLDLLLEVTDQLGHGSRMESLWPQTASWMSQPPPPIRIHQSRVSRCLFMTSKHLGCACCPYSSSCCCYYYKVLASYGEWEIGDGNWGVGVILRTKVYCLPFK